MALGTCPDCGNDVSSSAAACPHCGRPLRKRGSPVELSGILIIAAVCAGVLVWRLSSRTPAPVVDTPKAAAPETTIAEPTRPGVTLTATVGYNRKLRMFRVQNGDPFAWSDCQLSLNAQGVSSGYTHDALSIKPGITAAALLETAEFVDADGHRFDAAAQPVTTLDIACATPQGPRSYGGKF